MPDATDHDEKPAPLRRSARVRRALLSGAICIAAAAPSFAIAADQFSIPGMMLGVAIFAVVMMVGSGSDRFRRFTRIPHMRRSLTFVYGLRVLISALMPVSLLADLLPGLAATALVSELMNAVGTEIRPNGVLGTLITVLVQGVLLNLVLLALLGLIWIPQRMFRPPPERHGEAICASCGYCRDSIPNAKPCPECGSDDPPGTERATWIDRASPARFGIYLGLMTLLPILLAINLIWSFN